VTLPDRTADPYRDLDVIDARAPRFNQAVVGLGALLAVLTGWWPIMSVLAAQLGVGLRFGRRYCLPCVAYFELIQPRLGEGPIEDARPPRFANTIGFFVLSAATLAHLAGLAWLGWFLGALVAALALLAAATGFCAGCQVYRVAARLRGIRSRSLDRIDLLDIGLADHPDGEVVVSFGHPLCTDCQALEAEVRASGRRLVSVDVRSQRGLARKYGVALVPTAVAIAPDGTVVARLTG
jgi:thiol-disulfide isomerase/thioredoxin